MRCEKFDLPVDQCAHCRGVDVPPNLPIDWSTRPADLPPARPVREPEAPAPRPGYRTRILNEIDDTYQRLHEGLPAVFRGRSDENSAAYAGKPDPRKAPVRIEVLDLIHRIEQEVPDLARSVCDAMGTMRCIAAPMDSANGTPEISPRVTAALATLDRHWPRFSEVMPEMSRQVETWLVRLVATARRMLGQTSAPKPLISPCPSCGEPTIFRLETERGAIAVCGNPADRDDYGDQRQWTETEWEDAHPRFSHLL